VVKKLKTKNYLRLTARFTNRLKTAPKVFVGLSGGVDSSVSAGLLKEQGFDVVGVFIRVWSPDFLPCTWREDRRDAMRASAHLDIPFMTLDLEKEYKKEVVDYMIREYKEGKTPNPDVMCNKEIKFGAFFKFAMKNGADFVATGHYARKWQYGKENIEIIQEGIDKSKDQSYFLWTLKKEQIPKVLFPIGDMLKAKVRGLAKKLKLPNAEKKDSQGLCFLGKVDMKDFLSHFIFGKKGNVLNEKGKKIGSHPGAVFLTLGQRHGFIVENEKTNSKALFVVKKDIKKNTITVSPNKPDERVSGSKEFLLIKTSWIVPPQDGKVYRIRFRYHQNPLVGIILKKDKNFWISLKKPFIASSGQSAVIYDGDFMIGGGVVN